MDNFIYACVQLIHNIGAVIVVAAPVFALLQYSNRSSPAWRVAPAYYVLTGWLLQIISGITFGAVSYLVQGHIPQIEGIARAALFIKVSCAIAACTLSVICLVRKSMGLRGNTIIMKILLGLGISALFSAAFLRWYG